MREKAKENTVYMYLVLVAHQLKSQDVSFMSCRVCNAGKVSIFPSLCKPPGVPACPPTVPSIHLASFGGCLAVTHLFQRLVWPIEANLLIKTSHTACGRCSIVNSAYNTLRSTCFTFQMPHSRACAVT